jgi:hypothetical protein
LPKKAPVLRRPLMDVNGASKYTGLSPRWFRRMISARQLPIPVVKVNGRSFFDPDDLDRLVESFPRILPAAVAPELPRKRR